MLIVCFIAIFTLSVITVKAEQISLFDETKTIEDGQFWHIKADLKSEVIYTMDIDVTSGNAVDLVVLDSLNYGKYSQAVSSGTTVNFEYYSSYSSLNTKGKSYSITTSEDITLYFVVENFDFIQGGASGGGSVDVVIKVTYDSESAESPGFTIPIVLMGSLFCIVISKKKRN
jgi:hypothetical protein